MRTRFTLLLGLVWLLSIGAAAPVRMTPVKIADNVYMLQHSQGSGNSTVVFTDDGVLVFDISITPIRLSPLSASRRTRK